MGHDHHHHHDHHTATNQYNTAFGISVFLNLAFVVIQSIYAIQADSMSLLADAGHNLGDVLGLAFAWGANWLLTREANKRYSYGHKKTTILAALANALLLVAASAIISYESIINLMSHKTVNSTIVIVIALIGVFINAGTALLFLKGSKDDLNIKGAFVHLAADALISAGVVITGILIHFTQWNWLDPIIGLVIVFTILISTWGLLRDSVNLLLAAVPAGIDQNAVKKYLQNISGVSEVHDLHIWGLSTRENALTAHLVMPEKTLSDDDYQTINHELIHHHRIHHVTIQVEKGENPDPCGKAKTC
ncbi:MAG: cation transporter [Proteobacteria bacterium]|nr:cation transporter [Pseudomonadota bacterium]